MNQQQILGILQQIGLPEQQAKFYLAMLKIGPATISPIATEAGIKRTSAYNFVDELVRHGIVSVNVKNNRHYYQAEHPQKLLRLLNHQRQMLSGIMPDLEAVFAERANTPDTKMYYGISGLREALLSALACESKKIQFIIDLPSAVDTLGVAFWEEYIEQLSERKIIAHSLRHQEEKQKIPQYKYLKKKQYQHMTVVPRYLPPGVRIPNTIAIYDNTVVTASPPQEDWTMVVQSRSFSVTMRTMHQFLWEMSRTA